MLPPGAATIATLTCCLVTTGQCQPECTRAIAQARPIYMKSHNLTVTVSESLGDRDLRRAAAGVSYWNMTHGVTRPAVIAIAVITD